MLDYHIFANLIYDYTSKNYELFYFILFILLTIFNPTLTFIAHIQATFKLGQV